MALFFLLLAVGLFIFLPAGREVDFLLYTVVLVVLLIAVCYAKGEPPRWRWGKK
jgi:hypothetical protein